MPPTDRSPDRRLLQIAVAVAALVPIGAGLAGVLQGPALAHGAAGASLDSHFRYLSGLLLAMGLIFWGCIPRIEQRTAIFRLLTFVVVVGGLARLYSLTRVGLPDISMRLALLMELFVTPALCLWQGRLAARLRAAA